MLNAELQERIDIADGLFLARIAPDFDIPDFVPGQYVALGLPEDGHVEQKDNQKKPKILRRAYSIASSPSQKDAIEFYIAVVPDGELTPRLDKLAPGDRLFVTPKFVGTFTATELSSGMDVVLVSTGTGIAPYLSMLRDKDVLEKASSVTVLHGVRYSSDLAYREELLEYEKRYDHFRYLATVSRPDEKWSGDKGYVGQYFTNGTIALEPKKTHIFLCGNPAMIEQNEDLLKEKGLTVHSKKNPEGEIHLEKYW